MKIKLTDQQKIIFYKILNNILIFLLFVLAGALLIEVFIPGFISSYLSFSKIILAISLVIATIFIVTKKFKPEEMKNKKGFLSEIPLLTLALITIILSSLGFSFPVIALLSILYFIILFYLYKNFLAK